MINCMILNGIFRILMAIFLPFCIYLLHSSPLNFNTTTVESPFYVHMCYTHGLDSNGPYLKTTLQNLFRHCIILVLKQYSAVEFILY